MSEFVSHWLGFEWVESRIYGSRAACLFDPIRTVYTFQHSYDDSDKLNSLRRVSRRALQTICSVPVKAFYWCLPMYTAVLSDSSGWTRRHELTEFPEHLALTTLWCPIL
jgi:hypothetical protein